MADPNQLKSDVMKLAWAITKGNADVADAVNKGNKEASARANEQKSDAQEDKRERQAFFKDLVGELSSSFKSLNTDIISPIKKGGLTEIVSAVMLGLPALGTGIVAGITAPIAKLFASTKIGGKLVNAIKAIFGPDGRLAKIFKPVLDLFPKGGGKIGRVVSGLFRVGKVVGKLVPFLTGIIVTFEGLMQAVKVYQETGSILQAVEGFFKGVLESLTFGLYEADLSLSENFSRIGEMIKTAFEASVTFMTDAALAIYPKVLTFIDNLIFGVQDFVDDFVFFVKFDLKYLLIDGLNSVGDFFMDLPSIVMDTFYDLRDYLSGDGFTDMLASVMVFIEEIPGRLVDLGGVLFDGVMAAFSAIGGFLLDAGGDIIDFAKIKFLEFKVAIYQLLNNLSGGFLGNEGLEESQEALANELKQQREAKIKEDRERAAARAKAEEERERARAERDREREARKRERELLQQAAREQRELARESMRATPMPAATELAQEERRRIPLAQQASPAAAETPNVVTVVNNETNAYSSTRMVARDDSMGWWRDDYALA